MSLKQKVFINVFWSVGGQLSNNLIQLISNIIFARFLSPTEFGQLGIVMFFVLLSNVMIEGGLGGALVRKIDATDTDFSTVFIFNFIIGLFLYFILIINAGNISNYYQDAHLKKILIIIGSVLIVNSFMFIQETRLVKNLQFKKITKYKLFSVSVANIIGIFLLISGFGIWALVTTVILNPILLCIIYWFKEGFFGKIKFNLKSFKSLYAFGVNTSLASILDTLFNNIYQLVLGKFFSISTTGLFFQAKKLQDVPNSIVFGTTNSVIFASLANLQNDTEKFISAYNRIMHHFSLIIGLGTLYTILYSKEIILLLFGEKWITSGTFLIILASASFFYVHEIFNRVIFKIFNKTSLILKLEILKKMLLTISIIVGVITLDIKILFIGYGIISGVAYFINYYFSRKVISIHSNDEIKFFFKIIFSILISMLMFILVRYELNLERFKSFFLFPLPFLLYVILLRIQKIKIEDINIKELLSFFNKKRS